MRRNSSSTNVSARSVSASDVPFGDSTGKNAVAPWNEKYIAENTPEVLGLAAQDLNGEIPKALATNPDMIVAVNNAVTQEQYDNL